MLTNYLFFVTYKLLNINVNRIASFLNKVVFNATNFASGILNREAYFGKVAQKISTLLFGDVTG